MDSRFLWWAIAHAREVDVGRLPLPYAATVRTQPEPSLFVILQRKLRIHGRLLHAAAPAFAGGQRVQVVREGTGEQADTAPNPEQ
jgi:hypothetical protein